MIDSDGLETIDAIQNYIISYNAIEYYSQRGSFWMPKD